MNSFMFLLAAFFTIANLSHASRFTSVDQGGFGVKLIHPVSKAADSSNSTRSQRIARLVAKSNARVAWMARNLIKTEESVQENYESPLAPDGGAYSMVLSVGTPPQDFKAIADTGSDLVWMQSDPCTSCSGSIFRPKSSSTYKTLSCQSNLCASLPESSCGSSNSCQYLYQYGSGETSGVFSSETLTMKTTSGGNARFKSFAVGCGTENTGFGAFEGLVGLGQGPISLTSQLATAIDQRFSYCLVDISNSEASSPLYFGAAAVLKGDVQSTPIVSTVKYQTYYVVTVNGFTVAGSQLGSPGTTIVDSGTTLTYVPGNLYSAIRSKFKSLVKLPKGDGSSMGLDLCFDTSKNKSYKFPSLTIQFDGATLTPPASNYFQPIDDTNTCLFMGSAAGLPVSIIGNVMQQGYHILYDRGASKFSFVPEDCESLK